jgi:hypothetical protein
VKDVSLVEDIKDTTQIKEIGNEFN